jgi:catecholate siderophore receptor
MLRKTPLAAAIMTALAAPVAVPLYAHAQAAPVNKADQTAQADPSAQAPQAAPPKPSRPIFSPKRRA